MHTTNAVLPSISPCVYVELSFLHAGFTFRDGSGCTGTLAKYRNMTRAYPPSYLLTLLSNCDYHLQSRDWSVLRIRDLMDLP